MTLATFFLITTYIFGSMYFLLRFQLYKIFNMLYFKKIEKNSVKFQILKIH
jgi:hypothetical protein